MLYFQYCSWGKAEETSVTNSWCAAGGGVPLSPGCQRTFWSVGEDLTEARSGLLGCCAGLKVELASSGQ